MMFKKFTQFMTAGLLLALFMTTLNSVSVWAAPTRQEAACTQDYVVQAGDWLSKLAEKQYGDALAFPLIVEATNVARSGDDSYATITDPALIEVGWKVCLANSDEAPAIIETISDSDPAGQESKVRAASAAWDDAFNAADLERLMTLYVEDAVSMPPGLAALEGKTAIQDDFEWFFDNFESHHQTTIVNILISGNLAVERGEYAQTFTPKDGSEPFSETGKHIVVRKRSGNAWLVIREIWNANE